MPSFTHSTRKKDDSKFTNRPKYKSWWSYRIVVPVLYRMEFQGENAWNFPCRFHRIPRKNFVEYFTWNLTESPRKISLVFSLWSITPGPLFCRIAQNATKVVDGNRSKLAVVSGLSDLRASCEDCCCCSCDADDVKLNSRDRDGMATVRRRRSIW